MKVNWLLALATIVVAALTGSASVVRAERFTLTDNVVSHRFASAGCDTCGTAAGDCGCDDGCDLDCDDGCDDGCGRECGWGCDEPWRLLPEGPLGFSITGWVNGGSMVNADNPPSRFNGPLTFADREEFMLNQLYAVAERKIDSSNGLDVGGRMDLLFGTDYIFTQATGLETHPDNSAKWNNRRFYGLAMPQAYAEVGYGDLSVKAGHWYTPIGYETVTATGNFFYSHAYTHQYGEPFTHTGLLASYAYNDRVTIVSGAHNGWDAFDRTSDRVGILHGLTWTNLEGDVTLAAMMTSGDEFNPQNVLTNRTMYSLVGTFGLTERLQYVLQHDNGWQKDYFAPGVDAEWYGINQYLYYTLNDCWKAGTRFEWFRDDDGARVTGVRPTNPIQGASFVGNFYEISSGLNWTPSANLTVRPEVRYDWFEGAGLPFNDGREDDMFTAGIDGILLW